MIIAVDFDKTLHLGEFPAIGIQVPNAKKVMQQLKRDGHYLIIWTCREGIDLTNAVNWLLENEIPFSRINDHKPHTAEQYGYVARKVYADIYIDDKQIGGLPSWNDIYNYINEISNGTNK